MPRAACPAGNALARLGAQALLMIASRRECFADRKHSLHDALVSERPRNEFVCDGSGRCGSVNVRKTLHTSVAQTLASAHAIANSDAIA